MEVLMEEPKEMILCNVYLGRDIIVEALMTTHDKV